MIENNIQLSILIPSIPSRFDMARKKYEQYSEMIGDRDMEILMLVDNKKRSIGHKREVLKTMAQGKYFMFADDDDELLSLTEIYDATFLDVDVIDFKLRCKNTDGSEFIVTAGLGNEIEHNTKDGRYLDCKRPPFHNCAWHNRFKKYAFADVSYGEDWFFIEQCLKEAKTEHYIDKVLFSYDFNPNVTEASTESNPIWINPN